MMIGYMDYGTWIYWWYELRYLAIWATVLGILFGFLLNYLFLTTNYMHLLPRTYIILYATGKYSKA